MKRGVMKLVTWYALIGLLVAVAILPLLKAMAPQFFPEGFRGRAGEGFHGSRVAHTRFAGEGFRSRTGEGFNGAPAAPPPPPSCENNPCAEGQFCSDQKRCEPRYIGGAVPDGSE